jgi:RNAse (barnase) inhibitor barstar
MYYRAIRTINGSEHIEFKHFETIKDAYKCFLPTLEVQEDEGWHLKVLWFVVQELGNTEVPFYINVGNNVLDHQTSLYIQKVNQQDDHLPIL